MSAEYTEGGTRGLFCALWVFPEYADKEEVIKIKNIIYKMDLEEKIILLDINITFLISEEIGRAK